MTVTALSRPIPDPSAWDIHAAVGRLSNAGLTIPDPTHPGTRRRTHAGAATDSADGGTPSATSGAGTASTFVSS